MTHRGPFQPLLFCDSVILGHPHSQKVFPNAQREPPVFAFVPTACGPVTGHP